MEQEHVGSNHLINEISPYLRQHAYNPIDWYPWGEEALHKARVEDKPIFLSIGYSACHWCHVMEKESFTDERIALYLNQHFVSVKVDREERPDLDNIYMNAVVLLTGQGGWPTTVFLTPELEPFFGGTYFPPVPRHGMISFIDLLKAIHQAWTQDREHICSTARTVVTNLIQNANVEGIVGQNLRSDLLVEARDALLNSYDWQNGGWGRAPKFPQPILLEFLCKQAWRGHELSIKTLFHALDAMSQGGMYDLVGGGFHRYSTDAHWLVPHFEKMLYDNAQLALVYLHAFLLSNNQYYAKICSQTLDFIIREMTASNGGFYSSLDADSQGEEGKYYLWTESELEKYLTEKQINLLKTACPYPAGGNHDGKVIFQRGQNVNLDAQATNLIHQKISPQLDEIFGILEHARAKRSPPAVDTKILTCWNGLALRAFAEAGRYLDRQDYLELAQKNANFLLTNLWGSEGLHRTWNAGQVKYPAYLEDYGSLTLGLLSLYQADFNNRWFEAAHLLQGEMIDQFLDPSGGLFDTQANTPGLLYRPKELQDHATPSGNALAISAILMAGEFNENSNYNLDIEAFISGFQKLIIQFPSSFGSWMQILDFIEGPVYQIALILPQSIAESNELLDYLKKRYIPNSILAASKLEIEKNAPELLHGRPLIKNHPTAYVCQNYTCNLPTTTLQGLTSQLP